MSFDFPLLLPDERYLAALVRIRGLVANGLELDYENSDEIGNKYNYCTWGLCSRDKAAWPDAEDHLWPDEFVARGRVAPKYTDKGQNCPLCDYTKLPEGNGCFWACRVFRAGGKPLPTREQTLQLFDEQINKTKARLYG